MKLDVHETSDGEHEGLIMELGLSNYHILRQVPTSGVWTRTMPVCSSSGTAFLVRSRLNEEVSPVKRSPMDL